MFEKRRASLNYKFETSKISLKNPDYLHGRFERLGNSDYI